MAPWHRSPRLTGTVLGVDVAGKFHPVNGDLVILRRKTADDNLGTFAAGPDQGDAREAPNRFGRIYVWEFLNAGCRDDVHHRHRGELLIDRLFLSPGLGRDHHFFSFHPDGDKPEILLEHLSFFTCTVSCFSL